MKGLEKVYNDLDRTRLRVTRLVEMDRISSETGARISGSILRTMNVVKTHIDSGEDGEDID